MKWFISDTHFGHENVIQYCNRPFKDVHEMDATLIDNWNRYVKPDDTVFFLGDFSQTSVNRATQICKSLKGIKYCIRGNHDGTFSQMKRIGFDAVLDGATLSIDGFTVELAHHPLNPLWLEERGTYQLHGHVHDKAPPYFSRRRLNLSVEVWDYKPVSEIQVQKLLRKANTFISTQEISSELELGALKWG